VSNVTIAVLPLAVADLRKLGLDSPVWLFDAIVSADFHVLGGDIFYLESDDESFGIRVDKPGHALSNGMRANVTGVLKVNSDRERYIDADWAAQNGTGTVDPVGMNNRTLGGGPDGVQEGVKDGTGLNNIGLLVTTFGRFTYLASHLFTLDDGSGVSVKCFVETSQPTDPGWGYVAVRGVSSCKMISGELQRFIRVQSWDDVVPL
jgi:hypothetical protein